MSVDIAEKSAILFLGDRENCAFCLTPAANSASELAFLFLSGDLWRPGSHLANLPVEAGDPLTNFPDFYQQNRHRSVIPERDSNHRPERFQVAHGAFFNQPCRQ